MGLLFIIFIVVAGITIVAPKIGIPMLTFTNLAWVLLLIYEYGSDSFKTTFLILLGLGISIVVIVMSSDKGGGSSSGNISVHGGGGYYR